MRNRLDTEQLLSLISHEVRTPLATIHTSSEMLERYGAKMPEEKKNSHLQKIQLQVKHLTDLLDDLLFISKAESGKLTYRPESCQVPQFCEVFLHEIRRTHQEWERIDFTWQGSRENWYLDTHLLRVMMGHILINALKFSPESSRVQWQAIATPQELILRIEDHGIGIPDGAQPHIFSLFYRADNAALVPGRGLGLSMVKQALSVHNGHLEVQSELDEGTTVVIVLPSNES